SSAVKTAPSSSRSAGIRFGSARRLTYSGRPTSRLTASATPLGRHRRPSATTEPSRPCPARRLAARRRLVRYRGADHQRRVRNDTERGVLASPGAPRLAPAWSAAMARVKRELQVPFQQRPNVRLARVVYRDLPASNHRTRVRGPYLSTVKPPRSPWLS